MPPDGALHVFCNKHQHIISVYSLAHELGGTVKPALSKCKEVEKPCSIYIIKLKISLYLA